jgi:hypothetical protein
MIKRHKTLIELVIIVGILLITESAISIVGYTPTSELFKESDAVIIATVSSDSDLLPIMPKGAKPDFKYAYPVGEYTLFSIDSVVYCKSRKVYDTLTSSRKAAMLLTGERNLDNMVGPIVVDNQYMMIVNVDKKVNYDIVTTYSLVADANVLYIKPNEYHSHQTFCDYSTKFRQEMIKEIWGVIKEQENKDKLDKTNKVETIPGTPIKERKTKQTRF